MHGTTEKGVPRSANYFLQVIGKLYMYRVRLQDTQQKIVSGKLQN